MPNTLGCGCSGILTHLKVEFPGCSIQAHFVCFELQEPQGDHLRELLRIMGWDAARSARCLAQYRSLFPHAQRFHRREESIPECWWQAIHDSQRSDPVEDLEDIVGFLTSFLISETECERTFAHERRQFDNRPRLSPEMRFAGLKVMVDGMPLSKLQRDGEPVGTFWQCVQERYAQRFGSKPLRTMKRRSDAGVRRDLSEVRPGTDGKITMTALQRQRGKAVTPRISFASVKTDVFGYAPMVVSTLEILCEQERTKVFQNILKKAKAKHQDKQRLYRRVRTDRTKPICFVDSKEMKCVKQKDVKKKKAFASSNVIGEGRLSWKQLCESMGGSGHPWFFVEPGYLRAWDRACLDIDVGGKRFGDNVESDVLPYVRSTKASTRRIMLVDNIEAVPRHMKFAAAIVRARVQSRSRCPCCSLPCVSQCAYASRRSSHRWTSSSSA